MLQGKGSRYRGVPALALVAPEARRPAPPCPQGLQPGALRRWRALWRSPLVGMIDLDTDAEAVYRWIHCVSERERLQPLADKTPLVKGSTGQMTANPLYGVIAGLSKEIGRLEEHLGLTPLARMRLGIAVVQRQAGVADLRRRLDEMVERTATRTIFREGEPVEVVDLDAL